MTPLVTPSDKPLIVVTRGSDLALWQTERVRSCLAEQGVDCRCDIVKTRGDKDRRTALVELGSTGSFTHDLERILADRRADLAVHSLKDLPTRLLTGLTVAAILPRADVADVLLIHPEAHDPDRPLGLAEGARVGTGSTRRAAQLLEVRGDLRIEPIRGNVPTRVEKIRGRRFDATVLAAAGLERLGLNTAPLVRVRLEAPGFLPAPGQGAIAVECRRTDRRTCGVLARIHDPGTAAAVTAERILLARFNGGCNLPLGCLARQEDDAVVLDAVLGMPVIEGPDRQEAGPLLRASVRAGDPVTAARRLHREFASRSRRDAPRGRPEGAPLRGRVLALCRPLEAAPELADALREAGAVVIEQAVSERVPSEDPVASERAGAVLGDLSWCAFTSVAAVAAGLEWLSRRSGGASVLAGLKDGRVALAAVGPATGRAIRDAGLPVALAVDAGGGAELARALVEKLGSVEPRAVVLWPCAGGAREAFRRVLEEADHTVLRLPLYATKPLAPGRVPGLPEGAVDVLLLTSPSSVRGALGLGLLSPAVPVVAIGPTTAAAARQQGVEILATASRPCAEAIIEVIP